MKKKGISLIVLIITIVVIIILATAIIVSLARTNVIENANEATVKQDFRTLQDELNMYIADRFADTRGDFELEDLNADSTTNPSVYDVLPSLSRTKYKDDVVIVNGKLAFKDTMNAQIKAWATEVIKDVGVLPSPYQTATVGTIVSGTKNATITGENASYSNPVIPVGFKAIETSVATWQDSNSDGNPDGWNEGLVIADDAGNQFVWVPVDGTDVTYNKWCTKGYAYNDSNIDYVPASEMPTFPTGVTENTQITKYGGFYVGRYEAGTPDGTTTTRTDTTAKPQSKSGITVWTNINYTNANASAKSFCTTDYVKSGLLTGTSWDTVCKWINNEKDSNNNILHNVDDSRTWGNYSDTTGDAQYDTDGTTRISGSKQTAGFSEYWKAKNIYDFAGNTLEWTNEADSASRGMRGGCYTIGAGGSSLPASFRNFLDASFTGDHLGFRLMLYIM